MINNRMQRRQISTIRLRRFPAKNILNLQIFLSIFCDVKRVTLLAMRPFLSLENEQKSCAIRVIYSWKSPDN
jgi:hypothetical protein